MRRLAVALTLTMPMMVPLARSALAAKTNPPADALHTLPPRKRLLSLLHGLTMRTIPNNSSSGQSGEPASTREGGEPQRSSSHATLPPGSKVGPLAWHLRAARTLAVDGIKSQGGSDVR